MLWKRESFGIKVTRRGQWYCTHSRKAVCTDCWRAYVEWHKEYVEHQAGLPSAAESAAYARGLERAARLLDGDARIADECAKDEVRSADQVRLYYRACTFREAADAIRALAGSEELTPKETPTDLLRRLLELVDTVRGDSEGRYPRPDPGCIVCTSGAVPDEQNRGLCAEHAARAAIGEATEPPGLDPVGLLREILLCGDALVIAGQVYTSLPPPPHPGLGEFIQAGNRLSSLLSRVRVALPDLDRTSPMPTDVLAGIRRLLADGYGPGGGYYEPDQRIPALLALLDCGWGRGGAVSAQWLQGIESQMRGALHTMQGPVSDLEKRCHSDRPHNHDHLSALRYALRSLTGIHEKILGVLPSPFPVECSGFVRLAEYATACGRRLARPGGETEHPMYCGRTEAEHAPQPNTQEG